MTTFKVYYFARGCVFFTEPFVSVMAASEDGARELFHSAHPQVDYKITHIEQCGLYGNNARYSKYFKTEKQTI